MAGFIPRWLHARGVVFRQNYPLKEHTAYQVGGAAELAVFPETLRELALIAAFCMKKAVPYFVLGGGANVIIADSGLPGITIFTRDVNAIRLRGPLLDADCGVTLEKLASFAADRGIAGFSFLFDIPGSVGGSLIMNAGNDHGRMQDICDRVTVLERDGFIHEYRVRDARFGYRTSRFKEDMSLILSARFRAQKRQSPGVLREKNETLKRERWSKFPMEFPNGGSVFKRPPGDYAGRLIEVSGCGGMRVGDAEVSRKHHGFIVNLGRATGSDVRELIRQVQERVKARTGVKLEREQILLPEDQLTDNGHV